MEHKSMNPLFVAAWLFVICVSVIDGYLLLQNRDVIEAFEQNPLGMILLEMNGGQIWLFLSLKLLGTILTSMLLLLTYQCFARLGLFMVLSVAGFQFGLLVYLHSN